MRKIVKNKKGAEMTIGTIIIIVLALVVLVVLVVGFTGGWTNLWGRITSMFGGNNIDVIVSACNTACTTKSTYDYCQLERSVKGDANVFTVTVNTENIIKPGTLNEKKGKATCHELATWYNTLGFQGCSELSGSCPDLSKTSESNSPPSSQTV